MKPTDTELLEQLRIEYNKHLKQYEHLEEVFRHCQQQLKKAEEERDRALSDALDLRDKVIGVFPMNHTVEAVCVEICPQRLFYLPQEQREREVKFSILRAYETLMGNFSHKEVLNNFLKTIT